MNTYKQINIIIGLLFVGLVGTFLYYMFDSGYSIAGMDFGNRQAVASARQEEDNANRGGALYARYCRACHGLTGTGGLERSAGALPGAPLNADGNRPPGLAVSALEARKQRLTDTINCGRVGTRMPPWAIPQGGSLNDFQVFQLVTLITSQFSEEAWHHAIEDGNHTDVYDPQKFLAEDVGVDDDEIVLDNVSAMAAGDVIRIGLDEFDEPYELMKISEVDADTKTLTVLRGPDVPWVDDDPTAGLIGSEAIEHTTGDQIYVGPQAPDTKITGGGEGDAPCGQANAVAASAPEPVVLADAATIELGDNFFLLDDKQNPIFTLTAGAAVNATLTNTGTTQHNMSVDGVDQEYGSDDDIISDPDLILGGENGAIAINLPAGTYNYKCDFHPDSMKGTLVVE